MTTNPLVSIVVNNFNYAQFLRESIRSALRQTYHRTEIIVVDDGSTDDSPSVMASFGDRITPILKQNEGQASTFNTGFEQSNGEIIVFLDADDFLLPEAVERAVQLFDDHVVKVHWQLWEVDPQGENTGRLHKKSLIEGNFRDDFIRRGPITLPQSPTSGNAWPRWFLERVMPLPEHEDKHGADGFLKKLCPIFGEIRKIDEPLGCYRIHRDNYGGGRNVMFKFNRGLQRYPTYCRLLAKHLHDMGVDVDPADWMGANSQYAWLKNVVTFQDEIATLIPEREKVIMIDDNSLGQVFIPGCEVLPFLERGGQYWGQPSDDRQAIHELERMMACGARFVVVAFPAFWWLTEYPEFARYLQSECNCLGNNDRLVVFDLQRASAPAEHLESSPTD